MADLEPGAVAPAGNVAPVVAPDTTTNAPDTTADQNASPDGTQPDAKPVKDTFTQDELNKIVQKEKAQAYRKAEREAQQREERIRREVEQRVQQHQPPPQTQQPQGEPQPKDFKDYESYIRAVSQYEAKQAFATQRQQFDQQRQQDQRSQTEMQRATQVQKTLSSAAQKYDDFNEVVYSPDVPFTEPMAAAISKLKDGGEVAYFLGSNLDEARRISELDPVDQVWEIKAIEAKLTAAPSTTKTPPPIVPTAGPASVKKATFDLPWKEFVAQRKKEIARR